jgi:hypothetical protein
MRRAGRAGLVLERALPRNPLARLAAGGFALFFVIIAVAAMGSAVVTPSSANCGPAPGGVGEVSGLPPAGRPFASLYVGAAAQYELGQRGPAILAAIHFTESGFGENMGPSSAGALGQMQFMPATWAAYGVDANGDGEKDPFDAQDAIYSAANYLPASGAPGDWYRAIFAYNHADWYVVLVLARARRFGDVGSVADALLDCDMGSVGPAELARRYASTRRPAT